MVREEKANNKIVNKILSTVVSRLSKIFDIRIYFEISLSHKVLTEDVY